MRSRPAGPVVGPAFSAQVSAVGNTGVATLFAVRQGGIGNPAFEGVDRLRCPEALCPSGPGPNGLDGAEQCIEIVAGGIVGE